MTQVDKYSFFFDSPQRAQEALSEINDIFCKSFSLCLTISCGCEFEGKPKVCNSSKIESDFERNIFLNEGPSWTMIYMQDGVEVYLHFYNFGSFTETEVFTLRDKIAKFQQKESIKK